MNAEIGHNEVTVRLGLLAEDARRGLEQIERGEADALAGWLAYGAALNEGRALFPGDREFGEWIALSQLDTADRMERLAAMWAAANPDQFAEARAAGAARTVRGIHAKWREIEDLRAAQEARQREISARAQATANAEAEAQARLEAQKAKDAAERDAAEARAEAAARDREDAEARALQARADRVKARDPEAVSDLREGMREALSQESSRRSNKNPLHVPDAKRDRVISFTGDCGRIAAATDLDELASFDGHPEFRRQMLQQARAAHVALSRFLELMERN